MTDSFLTIAKAEEGLFKDKGSKFIAYAFPVETEEEIKEHIDQLKSLIIRHDTIVMPGAWALP